MFIKSQDLLWLGWDLGVNQSKLSLESPSTWIVWHLIPWTIRFASSVCYCSDGTMYPSLLSHRTFVIAVALLICKNAVKSCVFSSYCGVVCCNFYCFVWYNLCCFVYAFSDVVVVIFAILVVGFWPMTYVIFATLFVRFGVLLCNYIGFFLTCPIWSSENFPLFWFLIKFILFITKKKKKKK